MIVLAVVLVLGGRLVWLQGLQPSAYAEKSGVQRTRHVVLPAVRGDILDRHGVPLAESVVAKNVYAEPRLIQRGTCSPRAAAPCDPEGIAAALAPVLNLPEAELLEALTADRAFVYLARGLDPATARRAMALDLPGIGTESTTKRSHPAQGLAASVLGFTGYEGQGQAGIELAYQDALAGVAGKRLAQFDAFGRVIPTGRDTLEDPVPGKDVVLTLDRDLQWYAQSLLAKQVRATRAVTGSVIVMDIRTGEVLALATAPGFNPDDRSGVDVARLGNPAVSEVFEPGSVNKVITAAAALEAGVVTPMTPVTVPPTYKVGNHTLHDAEEHGIEHLTFAGVLVKSSNIGTVKIAEKVGPDRLTRMMRAFGFGAKSGLGLPGESAGLIREPKDWSVTSIGTIPIGQGVSVNAIQVASVYATIANDGVRVTPTLVKGVRDSAGHVEAPRRTASRRVISAEVARQIRTMLGPVVSEFGTAPQAAIPGYLIAGKTGTAQRVATQGDRAGFYDGTYTSSFVGMAPADSPRFVTAVILQGTGKRGYYGGVVAAPLFADVMGFALRAYEVPPSGRRQPAVRLTVN